MTNLAILADIHGNLPALEAVWDDLSQFDVNHVVVAGDSVNWGPCSREVLEFLTERRCVIMRGNHEYYLLDYDTPRAPDAWACYPDEPQSFDLLEMFTDEVRWEHTFPAYHMNRVPEG